MGVLALLFPFPMVFVGWAVTALPEPEAKKAGRHAMWMSLLGVALYVAAGVGMALFSR